MIIQTGGELMSCAKDEGPENTLSYLHTTYDPYLHRNSVKFLNPPCLNPLEHSLDVIQETWLAVFKDLKRFIAHPQLKIYEKPLAWLLTINRNQCFGHLQTYRKDQRLVSLDANQQLQDTLYATSDPIVQVINEEQIKRLREMISLLPERDQRVLDLYRKDIPHTVISTILNISPIMSRQILCRALLKLQNAARGENQI
jgi:RNA polymerase sigma factor (sigma-70 family)